MITDRIIEFCFSQASELVTPNQFPIYRECDLENVMFYDMNEIPNSIPGDAEIFIPYGVI